MVFTSDGTNTYQGSGFFINSNGLAVSNYHVFKGTGIRSEEYVWRLILCKFPDSDHLGRLFCRYGHLLHLPRSGQ